MEEANEGAAPTYIWDKAGSRDVELEESVGNLLHTVQLMYAH